MAFRTFLLAAAVFACGSAVAQSPPAVPSPGVGLLVDPMNDPAPTQDGDGVWRYGFVVDGANPHQLCVAVHTQTDVSNVSLWKVELRRWQAGDDPDECPDDYVESQEYYPLSDLFSVYSYENDLYYGTTDFITLDQTKFPAGGNSTYRLVSKLYRVDILDNTTTVETATSPSFRISSNE